MERKKILELGLIAIIIFFTVVGIFRHILLPNQEVYTPYFLLGLGLSCLVFGIREKKDAVAAITIIVSTFLIEVVGVHTGLPFGNYKYGTILGPKVFQTPIIIGLVWYIVIVCSLSVVKYKDSNPSRIKTGLSIGALALVLDIFLEITTNKFGYWYFEGPTPIQNYISWFLISTGLGFLFYNITTTRIHRVIYACMLVFVISMVLI
jgi:putative membrane protein